VDGDVAVVFGSERYGLSNEELNRCNLMVTIPTASDYSSLNLAMAVQVLTYELWLTRRGEPASVPGWTAGWISAASGAASASTAAMNANPGNALRLMSGGLMARRLSARQAAAGVSD
jgi:hypothetical protein